MFPDGSLYFSPGTAPLICPTRVLVVGPCSWNGFSQGVFAKSENVGRGPCASSIAAAIAIMGSGVHPISTAGAISTAGEQRSGAQDPLETSKGALM